MRLSGWSARLIWCPYPWQYILMDQRLDFDLWRDAWIGRIVGLLAYADAMWSSSKTWLLHCHYSQLSMLFAAQTINSSGLPACVISMGATVCDVTYWQPLVMAQGPGFEIPLQSSDWDAAKLLSHYADLHKAQARYNGPASSGVVR